MLTLLSQPIGAAALEHGNFKAGHALMQDGFKGMYDDVEEYLARLQKAGQDGV